MNKNVKNFKRKYQLSKPFNKSVDVFCDKLLQHWYNENTKDIPECSACSDFVKEGKVVLVLERKFNF